MQHKHNINKQNIHIHARYLTIQNQNNGLGALYAIRPSNESGLFYNSQNMHGAPPTTPDNGEE